MIKSVIFQEQFQQLLALDLQNVWIFAVISLETIMSSYVSADGTTYVQTIGNNHNS